MKDLKNPHCCRSFGVYSLLFALCLAFFWLFCGPTDGMVFWLLCGCLILPAAALGVSLVWGRCGGRAAYTLPLLLALSLPVLDFCTFRLTAFFAGNGLYFPWDGYAYMALFLLALSAAGLALGRLLRLFCRKSPACSAGTLAFFLPHRRRFGAFKNDPSENLRKAVFFCVRITGRLPL